MGLALTRLQSYLTVITIAALIVGIVADFFMLGYVIAWLLGL